MVICNIMQLNVVISLTKDIFFFAMVQTQKENPLNPRYISPAYSTKTTTFVSKQQQLEGKRKSD